MIEAVINADSPCWSARPPAGLRLQERYGVNLIAVSRGGERLTRRLGDDPLRAGDVIVLQGPLSLLPERLRELGACRLPSGRSGSAACASAAGCRRDPRRRDGRDGDRLRAGGGRLFRGGGA